MKSTLIFVIIVLAVMSCRSKGSEREFAQKLAERIQTIINEDPDKNGGMGPGETKTFIDSEHQLKATFTIPDIFGTMGGMIFGGSPTFSCIIDLEKFESSLGELDGELAWEFKPHIPEEGAKISDYTITQLQGILLKSDGDSVYVDYKYKVNASKNAGGSDKFDISTVRILEGKVKVSGKETVVLESN